MSLHRCICQGCGDAMYANRSDARFCGSVCRQRAYRLRIAAKCNGDGQARPGQPAPLAPAAPEAAQLVADGHPDTGGAGLGDQEKEREEWKALSADLLARMLRGA